MKINDINLIYFEDMNTHKLFIIIISMFFLLQTRCAGSDENPVNFEGGNPGLMNKMSSSNDETTAPPPPPPPPPAIINSQDTKDDGKNTVTIEKKIIKTADISIEVKNLKKSRVALSQMLQKYKAYVSNEKEDNNSNQLSNTITIRISSEHFDSLLNEICDEALNVESKNISLSDVTEEFIDITARLKNKKEVEKQYLELLKKANTVDDILNVNEHLRIIREEIESQEGRLKYLESQVSYSTINLYMYQPSEKVYRGYGYKLLNGLEGGWKGILAFIVGLAYGWPIILIIVLIVLFIRKRRKKKQLEK
jgi:hypothetical protein